MNVLLIPSADLSYNSGSVIYAKKLFLYLNQQAINTYMIGNKMPSDISECYLKNIIIKEKILFHPVIDDRPVSNMQYQIMLEELLDAFSVVYDRCNINLIIVEYASINSYVANIIKTIYKIPFIVLSFGRDVSIGYNCDERIKSFILQSLKYASFVIVPDKSIKKVLLKNIKKADLMKKSIKIVPMPFDSDILSQNYYQSKKKEEFVNSIVTITTINSCFTKEKGIDRIIEAVAKLNKNVVLNIVGADDDEAQKNKKRLTNLIDSCKINENVRFLGYLNHSEIGKILFESDLFIDAREGGRFSSVLLEAQFTNTLTLAANTITSRKIISNGNGLLFSNNSIKDLVNKIELLITDENIRKKIHIRMNKWISKNGLKYTEKYCFKEIELLIKRCVGK